MSFQVTVSYVPGVGGARPRIAVRFPAAPGATVVTVTDLATNANVGLTAGATVADANDALTIHYDTADIVGLNLETVGQKQLAIHFTPAVGVPEQAVLTVLPADTILALYEDRSVWIDALDGTAGTTPGVNGRRGNPVDNIADAIDLAGALGFGKFKILAPSNGSTELTIDDDVSGFEFEGVGFNPPVEVDVSIAGNFEGTSWKRCSMAGDFGDVSPRPLIFDECSSAGDLSWAGILFARECTLQHDLIQADGKFIQALIAVDCQFLSIGNFGTDVDIDFDGQEALVILHGMRGRVRITNNDTLTGGIASIISMDVGARFTVAASSTAAHDYHVSGNGEVINEAVGPVFIREAVLDEGAIGHWIVIDQREYVQDGPNQLQTKCRRSTFATEAARAAAEIVGAALVPPFVEGKHIAAVKTQYVESTKGANPGEPPIHTVRTL